MQFIDLQAQYRRRQVQIDAAIARVLQHGQYLFGPEITELENRLSDYVGVKHCIAMSSGTTALQVALMALDIQPGDEVITTPFSFFATAEVIYLLGAKPVYVDIDPVTYLIDVTQLTSAITEKTKAIIPVSLYGQCADMDAINAIARKHQIPVVEDAAQSFGAEYKGKKSCALSELACTSFFPSKPLGAFGDAGACFTNDDALAKHIRSIINHGQEGRYHHVTLGINGRMDSIQAAVLIEKLAMLDEEIEARQVAAAQYQVALPAHFTPPVVACHNRSVYAQYTVQVDDREVVQKALAEQGIPTAVHYPVGLHQQPVVASRHDVLSFPVTERCAKRVMSLPFYPFMPQDDIMNVCEALAEVYCLR